MTESHRNRKDEKFQYEELMEPPFSGLHYLSEVPGIYSCKHCKQTLFSSRDKFHCGSGWPAFDESHPNAVKLLKTEKLPGKAVHCSGCDKFLGTFITGEDFTSKNQRYNINSSALYFKLKKREEM